MKKMNETAKVSRVLRKKLEGYFNREIIEREFDPSGTGLHSTTPLVARLELAYMTAVDEPFKKVSESLPKKHSVNRKQGKAHSKGKALTPRTQRDTKLKGRAQTKDVLRLTKSSQDALNKISILDVINVHRYRSQGVPYEHVSKGKIPHVSHHVHAYLNSEEALWYSQEWDDRKLAQEYRAKCDADRKRKKKWNQTNGGTSRYSPRSNSWIDFRNSPLTSPKRNDECAFSLSRKKDKKILPPNHSQEEWMTSHSTAPTDTDSQTSSVRRYYVRKDTGTLPGDTELPSSSVKRTESTFAERDTDVEEETGSDFFTEENQSQENFYNVETNPGHKVEKDNSDLMENMSCQESAAQENESLSPVSSSVKKEEKLMHPDETKSILSKDQDVPVSVKEKTSPDGIGHGSESRTSYTLSPHLISRCERKRPKTARHSRSTFRSSSDDTRSLHSGNESRDPSRGRLDNGDETPGLFSVPDQEITDDADQRFGGSLTSIGDASSLLDELSIKSLSLQETFSGSYSLDFEDDDDDDDDGSSVFDNVSYNSRSRGRSQNGGISLANEETIDNITVDRSPSNQSNRTEEYIRTESVVSLR